jgi:hypothetical protein
LARVKTVSLRKLVLEELGDRPGFAEPHWAPAAARAVAAQVSRPLGLWLLLVALVLLYFLFVHICNRLGALQVFPGLPTPPEIRRFMAALWPVQGVVLAISISVMVMLTQATTSARVSGRWASRTTLRAALLYPTLAVGFATLITTGVSYITLARPAICATCFYTVATLLAIGRLYGSVWRLADDEFWRGQLAAHLGHLFRELLRREVVWYTGIERLQAHFDETRFTANPWQAWGIKEPADRVLATREGVVWDVRIPRSHALSPPDRDNGQASKDSGLSGPKGRARPLAGMQVGLWDSVVKGRPLLYCPPGLSAEDAEALRSMVVLKRTPGKREIESEFSQICTGATDRARTAAHSRDIGGLRWHLDLCLDVTAQAAGFLSRLRLGLPSGASPDWLTSRAMLRLDDLVRDTSRACAESGDDQTTGECIYAMKRTADELLANPGAPLFDLAASCMASVVTLFPQDSDSTPNVWRTGCRVLRDLLMFSVQPGDIRKVSPGRMKEAVSLALIVLANLVDLAKTAIDRRNAALFNDAYSSLTAQLHRFRDATHVPRVPAAQGTAEATEVGALAGQVLDAVDDVAFGLGAWAWRAIAEGSANADALATILSQTYARFGRPGKLAGIFLRASDPAGRHSRPWHAWEADTKPEFYVTTEPFPTWLAGFYCWCGINTVAPQAAASDRAVQDLQPLHTDQLAIKGRLSQINQACNEMRSNAEIWAPTVGVPAEQFQRACDLWRAMNSLAVKNAPDEVGP